MTRLSRFKARLRRNRELGQLDAANRCPVCKRNLRDTGAVQVWGQPQRFCSDDCANEFTQRAVR